MDDQLIDSIIENYEKQLKRNKESFSLTPFERVLIKQGMLYGYEHRKHEELNESIGR